MIRALIIVNAERNQMSLPDAEAFVAVGYAPTFTVLRSASGAGDGPQ